MATIPNAPAFPFVEPTDYHDGPPEGTTLHPGLTKREHFAALAMQGIMASDADKINRWSPRMIAQVAVDNADALIAELNLEDRLNG